MGAFQIGLSQPVQVAHSHRGKYNSISRNTVLEWRHNGHDGVSNHQPHHCLLNRLFRCRSKKTSNSASMAFVREIHRWLVNSPHKWPVMRKMLPFDDVIMSAQAIMDHYSCSTWASWCLKSPTNRLFGVQPVLKSFVNNRAVNRSVCWCQWKMVPYRPNK